MSPALANFLFEAANFLLLAAALGWLLFKPVRSALDAERQRYVEEERKVAALREKAEALERQSSEVREQSAIEIKRESREVLANAQRQAARIKEEAEKTQYEQVRSLERDLEQARKAQAILLAESVGRVAAASVRRLLDTLDGPSLDLALVRGACEELRALQRAPLDGAVVETPRPIDDEARRLLRQVLGDRFEERTVAELGAGVRVSTSAGQVDASALALAREAARQVANEMRRGGDD